MQTSRLHVVLGKGGVGKSTVSAALALAAHEAGQRVLAIELDEVGGLCRALSATPSRPGAIEPTTSGVSVAVFEGSRALAEYLGRVVRLGPLLEPVLAHPLYRAFVDAAPGLRELMVVGKLRDELLLQRDGRRPRWDALVVDAGASGHALEYLRMPLAAVDTFGSGRVHREARRIVSLLADRSVTSVHVVALPEEMPVEEAVELGARLRGEAGLEPATLIVNACREVPPAGAERLVDALAALEPRTSALARVRREMLQAARRTLGWLRIQERCIARAEEGLRLEALRLPLLVREPLGLPELRLLSQWLRELVE